MKKILGDETDEDEPDGNIIDEDADEDKPDTDIGTYETRLQISIHINMSCMFLQRWYVSSSLSARPFFMYILAFLEDSHLTRQS